MNLVKMPYEVSQKFYLKILLYGQPGIGKSTLSVSMPNPILIDCDNGVHRIAVNHRVPFLPVNNYDEIINLINSDEISDFNTIIIDTAGKLLDYIASYITKQNPKLKKRDGTLSLQGYGARKYEFLNLLKNISTKGKHLVFVAHEVESKVEDDRIIRPDVGGSSGADLIKELDLVGYMEAVGKHRKITFAPTDKFYAKNSARLDDIIEIPQLENESSNNFMSNIINECLKVLDEESGKMKQYTKLMEDIENSISIINDIETANSFLKELKEKNHIWDSRRKSWDSLKVKTKSIGIKFDIPKGVFINIPDKNNITDDPVKTETKKENKTENNTTQKPVDDWKNDKEYLELVELMTSGAIEEKDIVIIMNKYFNVSYYQHISKDKRSTFLENVKTEIENMKKSFNRKAEKDIETVPPKEQPKILDIRRMITSKKIPIKKVIEISIGIMPAPADNKLKNISDFTDYYNNLAEFHQHNILNSVIDTVNAGDK